MRGFSQFARRIWAAHRQPWQDEEAAQILEFALSLPLLVVFVVGIFDFSGALSLKQKLTNAAREAARVAAADPANDLAGAASGTPASVLDALQVVDKYLNSENIYPCGLTAALPSRSGTSLTWVSTGTACGSVPPNGIILTINRGFVTKQNIGTVMTDVVNTQVTIQYGYKWSFNRVIKLLVPRAANTSVSYITTGATAFNEN
jgi:Flp pilus assembly protein TadG